MSDTVDQLSEPVRAVKICHSPYTPQEVQALLQAVQKDFGKNKDRYYWKWVSSDTTPSDTEPDLDWVMAFYFRDPHDAIMFSLKYSR
jgi:hypothetical protein